MIESVQEVVRSAETNYVYNSTKLSQFVDWSMYDTVERITAYLNSRHTSGAQDSLGRDKPFFNIVTAAVNIWYRATDIDRKDIIVRPDNSSTVAAAFLATVHLQEWMKKSRFGVFLNLWGRTLSGYGSAVCKFVEKDGMLFASVVPWNRIICDPVDFDALPRIEKFYKTPAQLMNMATPGHPDFAHYDKAQVQALQTALTSRKTLQGINQDEQSEFVELYEVHGELPVSLLTGNENDNEKYRQQMHVVCYLKATDGKTGYDDFTLYKGKEKKDPYMITHLIKEDGRTLSIGAVEYLFDAQWMQNHTMKNMKDLLDLSSKMIYQTADAHYVGRNVLTAIETGDIMIHDDEKPLTQINTTKYDITALQNFSSQWKVLAQELTSTPDAIRGNTMPSGTPYSLAAYSGAQANSLFEVMTENKGLAIEDMLRQFIIPHVKTKMDSTDEVAATLQEHDISKIDTMFVPKEAVKRYNEKAKADILAGKIPSPYDPRAAEGEIRMELAPLGNQRFIDPEGVSWKDVVKDLEWSLDVGVTNEPDDKQAVLTTLSTILQTIAGNPMILQDPNARLLFNKILSMAGGTSPLELSTAAAAPPAPAAAPPSGGVDLAELAGGAVK